MMDSTKPLAGRAQALLASLHEAHGSLPDVLAAPQRVRAWLWGARRAQVAAVLLALFGLLALPGLRDAAIAAVLPKKVSSGFLGFGRRVTRHPLATPARVFITGAYWLGGAATTFGLLWLQLPVAARVPLARRREDSDDGQGPAATAATQPAATAATQPAATTATQPAATGDHRPPPAGAIPPATGARDDTPPARYAVERELGRGGMGVVCLARDSVLGRQVALKQLVPEFQRNAEVAARFRREAQVLAGLMHRHIVQIFDLHAEPSGMWMAMELVAGGSLGDRLKRDGRMPFAEVLRLAKQMAEALAHAHARGIVHRDFKPGNVMLSEAGEAKVADFGLAALTETEGEDATKLTRPGAMMGSPAYMSPEQISGKPVDARTDIYAFGATLYEMVNGTPPFDGNLTAVLTQHLTTPPVLPPPHADKLPTPFVTLLGDMLQKDPGARAGSMADVLARLEALACE